LITAARIWHDFNNSTKQLLWSCSIADALVWRDIQV
jgi:hypothetical protein